MSQNRWQVALGFLLIGVVCVFVYFLFISIGHFLSSLDKPLVVAILAASGTVLASTITVVIGRIFERKSETEAHFRQRKYELYYDLLKLLYELTLPESNMVDTVKRLTEWQRNLILFAGPHTIRHFVDWMNNLKSGKLTLRTIMLMEAFYRSLRSDLGISNLGLKEGDLAHLVLRHGDLYLKMAKQNPDMPLSDLAEMEKAIEQVIANNAASAAATLNPTGANPALPT